MRDATGIPLGVFLVVAGSISERAAAAEQSDGAATEAVPHRLSAGVRFGFVPPIFAVAELLARPIPQLGLGIFGMAIPDKRSIGGEVMLETRPDGISTPYFQLAYLYYRDRTPRDERAQVAYATAGYIWRTRVGPEFQLGAGALFIVSDQLPQCTEFCFSDLFPKILPTVEMALRFNLF
jgi:hypothetical protein